MILHLIGQLDRGGAEKQLFSLAKALQKRGWQQTVVSFSPGGVWSERLEAAAMPFFVIPKSPIKPWRLWRLWWLVRRLRPRVIISWSWHVAVYADWLVGIDPLARIINVRCDLRNDQHSGAPKDALGRIRRTLERADYVVSNSRANLDALRAEGVRLPAADVVRNIVAIPGGVPPRDSGGIARIVAVGTLIPLKALDVLLRAAAILAAEGRKFAIALAGNGSERANLEALTRELGIEDRVSFLGDVDDIPALLATAQVFVHPSRSEGLSNAILEAMAASMPVVACPVGATPELIEDGKNGLLVPAGEPRALAAALARLLDDAELRARLGRNACQRVCECCGEEAVVIQYEKILHHLIGHRS